MSQAQQPLSVYVDGQGEQTILMIPFEMSNGAWLLLTLVSPKLRV